MGNSFYHFLTPCPPYRNHLPYLKNQEVLTSIATDTSHRRTRDASAVRFVKSSAPKDELTQMLPALVLDLAKSLKKVDRITERMN